MAGFGDDDVARLLADPGIVRNRLKVESAIANARAVLALRDAGGSLVDLLWSFVGGVPLDRLPANLGELPAETAESRAMSRELKRRGFRFVGPDRLLRVHAGHRPGQRPYRRLRGGGGDPEGSDLSGGIGRAGAA